MIFSRLEHRVKEKMTPGVMEAFRKSNTWYLVDKFSFLDLLVIAYWKLTGK